MSDEETLTEEEAEQHFQMLTGTGSQSGESQEKQNVHTFLKGVSTAEDTTKLGNLKEEEVGIPYLPVRTYKELALFCKDVADMDYYADYFEKKSEILTSTSLSKDAKLISLATLQRREVADVTKPKKENKGWFGKKNQNQGE